jgi:glucose/arabinose dehydrogenase
MGHPRLLICAAAVLLAACTSSTTSSAIDTTTPPVTSAPAPTTPPSSPSQPVGGTIIQKTVATGLDHPATFVLDKTGAIYYGERLTGEIRRIDPTTGKNTSVFTVPNVIGSLTNEQRLVGLTLPPSFPQQPWLYAYATRKVNGVAQDQILRIKMNGIKGTAMQLVLNVQQAGIRHNGGRLLFGPDGMLYVVVGETEQDQLAQARSVNSGKVLRMTPTGGVPKDHPFTGSFVYSYS